MSAKFKKISNKKDGLHRVFYKHEASLPLDQVFGGPFYHLFLAMDAALLRDDALYTFAYHTVKTGMACLYVWGQGCDRLKAVFEEVSGIVHAADHIRTNIRTRISTADSDSQTLEDAARCYLDAVFDQDGGSAGCPAYIMSVGRKHRSKTIRKCFRTILSGRERRFSGSLGPLRRRVHWVIGSLGRRFGE
ncbi:hypothetical protein JW948_05765 [bacterium]|nr:hypothetical protein [bacterium]